MIWQVARVIGRDGDRLTLVFSAPEQCARCARGEGCGAGVFARLFGRRETRVVLPGDAEASPGQWVRVGLVPRQLALAAAWHYGLPLAGFLLGALAAAAAMPSGAAEDLTALATGLVAFAVTVRFVRRFGPTLEPVVERLSCTGEDTKSLFS